VGEELKDKVREWYAEVARRKIEILQDNGAAGGEQVERIVALGRALSDPIRVRMLGMIAGVGAAAFCRISGSLRKRTRRASASASSRATTGWASPRSPTTSAS
jgi:hypothetical protein